VCAVKRGQFRAITNKMGNTDETDSKLDVQRMGHMESFMMLSMLRPHVETMVSMLSSLRADSLHAVSDGGAGDVLSHGEALGSILCMPGFMAADLLPECAQIFASGGLFAACVSTLQKVQWLQLVAQLRKKDMRIAGAAFPPTPFSTLDDSAAAEALLDRKRACTSLAELVLLLLRACLRVACKDGKWTGAVVHADALAALSGVWAPFADALRALLEGLQPKFRSWPSGVSAVDDILSVRPPCACNFEFSGCFCPSPPRLDLTSHLRYSACSAALWGQEVPPPPSQRLLCLCADLLLCVAPAWRGRGGHRGAGAGVPRRPLWRVEADTHAAGPAREGPPALGPLRRHELAGQHRRGGARPDQAPAALPNQKRWACMHAAGCSPLLIMCTCLCSAASW
jgi:hypothetical protein